MSFKLDSRNFRDAINYTLRETGKELPKVLNSVSLDVAIKAIQKTPRADKGKIKAVTDAQLRGRILKRARATGRKIKTSELPALIKKERRRMNASIAYTAGPGWDKAARAFGGRGVRRQKGFGNSQASKGSGRRASAIRLETELVNTTPAGEKIGKQALQNAVDTAADNLRAKTDRQLSKIFQKVRA